MKKWLKKLLIFTGLVIVLVLWDIWTFHYEIPDGEPAFASTSPDGRFTVSVYYNAGIIPIPNWIHPRGRAGTVVLRETKTGKVLQRAASEYVHATGEPTIRWIPAYKDENVNWPEAVTVVSIGSWDLPPADPSKDKTDPVVVSRFLAKECTGMEPFPRSRVFLDFHGISREGLKDYPNSIKCFKEDASFCAPPSGSVGIGGQTVAEFWLDLALARYGSDIYLITKLLENVAMCENFKEEKSYDKKRKGEVLHALSKYCSDDASEISLILHQVYANDEDRSKQLADIDLEMNAICSQIQQGSNP